MKPRSRLLPFRSVLVFSLLPALVPHCEAQSKDSAQLPYLYRWSFEAGGLPDSEIPGAIQGGELTICGGEPDRVPLFQQKGGVSEASPGVLNASHNSYGSASGAQVNSYGSPLRTERNTGRFTITMWIKPELPQEKQPQACLFNLSTANNERSPQSLFIGFENGGFAVCVNNSVYYGWELKEPVVKTGEWVFLAFCYDGVTKNPYYSQDMLDRFKIPKNGAILAGDRQTTTRLVSEITFTTGAPTYAVSPGELSINGLLTAIGSSNTGFDRSFAGWIDDVRIYDGLLSISELDRVRLEALGK